MDTWKKKMEINMEIYFWYMSKEDAINIMKNPNLNEKSKLL